MSTGSLLRSVVRGLENGESFATVSRRFHQTLVEMLTEITHRASLETGIKTVVLSGGVFQNQLLFTNLVATLNRKNFNVVSHAVVPTNDGCLSFGQAIIGRHYLQKEEKKCA
jgi:hydrogenase maturation protein HypF